MQKTYFGTMTKLEDTYEAVMHAFQAGYQKFDFAEVYHNQSEIGRAITDWFKQNPNLKRESYFFQSKVWVEDIDKHDVDQAIEKILQDLKLEYIDSLLVHRPSFNLENSLEAYKKLLEWKEKGIVKHVGVSNFEKEQILYLWASTTVKPEFHQFELNIHNQRWDRILFAQKYNIEIQAYGSFKGAYDSEEISQIAKNHKATNNQVILAWLNHYKINRVLKSTNFAHMQENIKPLDFKLTEEELATMKKLNRYDNYYTESVPSPLVKTFYEKIKR
ncbi:aldo/keto reductase family protein [Williamsoniiplasma lucivorax]|uniref:Aldo/keto reductase n=1 Tax=Williamsoniiplasma lucivorax TaxID=209274 RepID=A0A2S5RDT9_9MOLU|nr:aldo/keto reductase [Williamsoniiplasma lucivorax]PPE05481.1 aldo/keto reductase [Williamsoniiplasma lucivorax]